MSQETRPLQELNQIFPISEVIPENILKTIQNAEFGTDLSRRLDFGKFESEQLIADIVESSVRAGRWQGTIIDTTIEDPHNLQQSIHAFFRHLAENRVLGYKEGIERLINNNWASIVFHNGKLALVPTPDGITKLKNQFDTSIRFVTANPPPDKKQAHAAPAEDEVNMIIETFLRETQLTEQINERIENFSPDEKNTYQRMLHYFQLDNQVDVATAESIFYELFDSDDYSPQEKKSLDDVLAALKNGIEVYKKSEKLLTLIQQLQSLIYRLLKLKQFILVINPEEGTNIRFLEESQKQLEEFSLELTDPVLSLERFAELQDFTETRAQRIYEISDNYSYD